jgi:hypothetical protein
MLNDYPSQATVAESQDKTTATGMSIDDRERALKAQKKKEKNARKKARLSGDKN